jgi:hypothetical protein
MGSSSAAVSAPFTYTEGLQNKALNLVLLKEAEALALLFERAGIPAIFLKGIALLDEAYKDLAARSMIDIDVLVHGKNLPKACRAISEAGYVMNRNALVLHKQVGCFSVYVDVHPKLWFFRSEAFWQRSRPKNSPLSRMRVLSLEDQLLHCILHSVVQDGEITEQAIEDCNRILESSEFRWNVFTATVIQEGWERPVELFIETFEGACPGTIPRIVLKNLCPFNERSTASRAPYPRILRMQSNPWRRFGLLREFVFPSSHFLKLRYSWVPRPLAFFLPACRPFLLLSSWLACRLAR